MKAYVVVINDHSNLGGPMGSEYVIPLEKKYFFDYTTGIKWAFKKLKNYGHDLKVPKTLKEAIKMTGDLGNVGVEFLPIQIVEG